MQTDDKFIQTGTNEVVSPDAFTTLKHMNSLRVFTEQNKNCYVLPSTSKDRYFIRAMFKYPGDEVNRMWEPAPLQDLISIVVDMTILHYTAYEHPPLSLIFYATEAQTSTDSITLSFADSKPCSLNYILMYFTEMTQLVNDTRSFHVYDFVLNRGEHAHADRRGT
ncbi:hypothetical protein LguiB_000902 [Lonicera macranthoides]